MCGHFRSTSMDDGPLILMVIVGIIYYRFLPASCTLRPHELSAFACEVRVKAATLINTSQM